MTESLLDHGQVDVAGDEVRAQTVLQDVRMPPGASTDPQVTPGRAATPGADDPVQKYADSRIDRDLKQAGGCGCS